MPALHNIVIYRGWTHAATFLQQTATGSARDITGSSFSIEVLSATGESLPPPGLSVTDAAGGVVLMVASQEYTAALPAVGSVVTYRLSETLPDGSRLPRAAGRFIITLPEERV